MSREHPGIVEGWLEPSGVCHLVSDSHCEWASRHLKIPLPPLSKNHGMDFMKVGIALDKHLFDKGWCKTHIQPEKNILYFMTLNKPWQQLSSRQRSWIYEVASFGAEVKGEKIVPGLDKRVIPMKVQFGNNGAYIKPEQLKEQRIPMFGDLMKQVIYERMTYGQLYNGSESGRKERGDHDVRASSTQVNSTDDGEAWTFRYKSNPSTTGRPWHGFIQFFKEDVGSKENAEDLECMIDCDCPDYRYRYAYNNRQAGAGWTGKHSGWTHNNQNNGQKWRPRSQGGVGDYGVGLCKHLCALKEYLDTVVEPNAPQPDDKIPLSIAKSPEPVKQKVPASKQPQTTQAPKPEDTYSDSRTGSDTLQEGQMSKLYEKIDNFVKSHPQFDVMM